MPEFLLMRKLVLFSMLLIGSAAYGQKSYQRTLSVQDPCSGNGIFTSALTNTFSVYPNPSNGNVSFSLPVKGTAVLCDIKGTVVRQAEINDRDQWELSGLSAGVYLISVYTESTLFRTKLILEK